MAASLAATSLLMRRSLNELVRVPGAAIPGVLAPTLFVLGLTAVFGKLSVLPGFSTDDFMTFILAVGLLQCATFSGAATGVNLARDIEQGWFDRLLASPTPRGALLAGTILSASFRALLPIGLLLAVALALGARTSGPGGVALALLLAAAFASIAAAYAVTLAFRFRTQAAAPLMQAGAFMAVLFTTSYAPQPLLTGWLYHVAKYNPVTKVLEAVRQGFVSEVTWATTWPGLVTLAALALVFAAAASVGLRRMTA